MFSNYTELEEFKTYKGSSVALKQEQPLNEALKKCEEDVLRADMINSIINLIDRVIAINFKDSDAHIFPISIQPNQVEHLSFYLHLFESTL